MQSPTQKIIAPTSGVEIEIKDWISGGDAEYIDSAIMSGVDIKPDIIKKTATTGKFDTAVLLEQDHRLIEKFIVSVAGITEKILDAIKDLPEDDYAFVKDECNKRRKKKEEPVAGQ